MNRIINRGADYKSYRGLPVLAGVATIPEAMTPGLSVDECVARLKHYHYALKRLHQIFISWIPSEPIYELKMAFSLHSHYCAEHVAALRKRVGEMREPPLGLDQVPQDDLKFFFDEILSAPDTGLRLLGIYAKAVPALIAGMRRHIAQTNPVADHPSIRVCRFALLELEEMAAFGEKAIACLVPAEKRDEAWLKLLDCALARAGAIDGTETPSSDLLVPRFSGKPFVFDGMPKRDERFLDPNLGFDDSALGRTGKAIPAEFHIPTMFYRRMREINVPELMAGIMVQTPNKPWGYYQDMTRQLWDEARHALMGEIGFISIGVDWKQVPMEVNFPVNGIKYLTPLERHAILYAVEQGMMPKTGMRLEWETAIATGHPLAVLFQDYDWADEVLHAQIGRQWCGPDLPDGANPTAFAERTAAEKIPTKQAGYGGSGPAGPHNYWPEVFRQACEAAGITPDPAILAATTPPAENGSKPAVLAGYSA